MSKICVLLLAVPILSGGCTFTPDWDDAREQAARQVLLTAANRYEP